MPNTKNHSELAFQKHSDELLEAFEGMLDSLRKIRLLSGMTVSDVARTIGASTQQVEAIEDYDANPTLEAVQLYAMAVGANVAIEVTPRVDQATWEKEYVLQTAESYSPMEVFKDSRSVISAANGRVSYVD